MTKPELRDYKLGFRINEVSMAKKTKRRGRPPGSKNKKSIGKSVEKMDVMQLRAYIDDLQSTLAKKVNAQRAYFEDQLSQLGVSKKTPAAVKTGTPGNGRTGQRAKPKAKYQSKKNKSLKWTGRGVTPVWMRDEMTGTKLTKDSFLIK